MVGRFREMCEMSNHKGLVLILPGGTNAQIEDPG